MRFDVQVAVTAKPGGGAILRIDAEVDGVAQPARRIEIPPGAQHIYAVVGGDTVIVDRTPTDPEKPF